MKKIFILSLLILTFISFSYVYGMHRTQRGYGRACIERMACGAADVVPTNPNIILWEGSQQFGFPMSLDDAMEGNPEWHEPLKNVKPNAADAEKWKAIKKQAEEEHLARVKRYEIQEKDRKQQEDDDWDIVPNTNEYIESEDIPEPYNGYYGPSTPDQAQEDVRPTAPVSRSEDDPKKMLHRLLPGLKRSGNPELVRCLED